MHRTAILREQNERIKAAIERVNEHLDFELTVRDLEKEEQKFLRCLEQHKQAESQLEEAMTLHRYTYVALSAKMQSNIAVEHKRLRGMYFKLLRKYEAEARLKSEPVRPIEAWEIPHELPPPVAVLPRHVPEFRNDKETLLRHVRQSLRHYHFRAHWKTSSAGAHLERLALLESEQKKDRFALLNKKKRIESNIEQLLKAVADIRHRLVHDPPSHIWTETFNTYAALVRQHFREMQSGEMDLLRTLGQRMHSADRLVPKLHTMPARSSLRRMADGDINDLGALFAALDVTLPDGSAAATSFGGSSTPRHAYATTEPYRINRLARSMNNLNEPLQHAWTSALRDARVPPSQEAGVEACADMSAMAYLLDGRCAELPPDLAFTYTEPTETSSVYDEGNDDSSGALTPDTPAEEELLYGTVHHAKPAQRALPAEHSFRTEFGV